MDPTGPRKDLSHQDSPSSWSSLLGCCLLSVLNKCWGLTPHCGLQKGERKDFDPRGMGGKGNRSPSPTCYVCTPRPPCVCGVCCRVWEWMAGGSSTLKCPRTSSRETPSLSPVPPALSWSGRPSNPQSKVSLTTESQELPKQGCGGGERGIS